MKYFVIAFLLAGCGSKLSYIKNSPGTYPLVSTPDNVKVYFENPKETYETLGSITYGCYHVGIAQTSITECLPKIRQKAQLEMGDGIIIRKSERQVWNANVLDIVADVIRLK